MGFFLLMFFVDGGFRKFYYFRIGFSWCLGDIGLLRDVWLRIIVKSNLSEYLSGGLEWIYGD